MTCSHPDSWSVDNEAESYSPMKHRRLVTDGKQFFEVPTRPSSPQYFFDSSRGTSTEPTSASPVATAPTPTHPLPNLATTTSSTAPAAVAFSPPSHSPPPSTLTTATGGPQLPMSQGAARAVIEAFVLASAWFQAHEMEPCADDTGVPDCALLLARPGESIWACFFERTRRRRVTIFKCLDCPHKTDRFIRAVDHQRAKWKHEPFACPDAECEFRGSTSGGVVDHRSARTAKTTCEGCGKAIMVKNMPRHQLQHCH